jgi:hypothetical protein
MALNITTPVNTSIGVTIPTSYARVAVNDAIQGTALVSTISVFASKAAFESGADPLGVIINERFMDGGIVFPYNRETDGPDILGWAHTKWVIQLDELGITAVIDLP